MKDCNRIAGYCRISVDEELDRENTSIENQKSIISDYVMRKFPDSSLDFYEDRDRSGYTFEQREGYQKLRTKMMNGEYDILIVKDFSRFSRRNSKGLVELEDLRDAGMRIVSINDNIDYPTFDDWTAIQFRFLMNEMPVTDTSKKVKSVIKRRQEEGKWICAVPYGYVMTNSKQMKFEVSEPEAEIVREVFRLYNEGWGYKKIADHLSDKNIPTPRMAEKARKEAAGEICRLKTRNEWSIQTISEMISNDFYIGTLRQRKYRRKKINGSDEKLHETDQLVFENNHTAIIDYREFAQAQDQLQKRTQTHYRGVKKYDNVYSGYLFCGDCGSPMFSMSRSDLPPAYRCGEYHRHGVKACSSHHTRVDMLDDMLKSYIRQVRDNSQKMLDKLQRSIDKEKSETQTSKSVVEMINNQIEESRDMIKALINQNIKDKIKHPEREDILDELYQEQIDDLTLRIEGLKNQLQIACEKHNSIVRVNRTARTVIEVFDNIINKNSLTKADIDFIVSRIVVFTDHIDIHLKADIDALLKMGTLPEIQPESEAAMAISNDLKTVNPVFKSGTKKPEINPLIARKSRRNGENLSVNVISDGEPLEIYTSSDGEVIFKKYSPINELSEGAVQAAEVISKLGNAPAVIFDNDHVVAVSGASKKEYSQRRLSAALEEILQQRKSYEYTNAGESALFPVEGIRAHALAVAPIISNGDVSGAVAFVAEKDSECATTKQALLAKTAALFLGKQIEE